MFSKKKNIDIIILGRNRFEDDKIDSKKRNALILPKINKQTPKVFKYFSVTVVITTFSSKRILFPKL